MKMKRILALTLAIIMLFAVVSCGKSDKDDSQVTTSTTTEPTGTTPKVTTPEETTPEETTPEDTGVIYTVTVVDENNAPLAGAWVQLCEGEICLFPVQTDANGIAVLEAFKEADYTAKVTLEGYTGETEYHFAGNSHELTIQLSQAN